MIPIIENFIQFTIEVFPRKSREEVEDTDFEELIRKTARKEFPEAEGYNKANPNSKLESYMYVPVETAYDVNKVSPALDVNDEGELIHVDNMTVIHLYTGDILIVQHPVIEVLKVLNNAKNVSEKTKPMPSL